MKPSWHLLLALVLALPVRAQDEAPADDTAVVPVEDAAAAEPAAEAESATGMVEEADASGEATGTEEVAAEEVSSEPAEPWQLYAGLDYVLNTLSLSGRASESAQEFDTGMYRLRFGRRMFEAVGIEAHLGIGHSADAADEVETDSYYGLYVVPTATVAESLELAFPVGYAFTDIGSGDGGEGVDSIAYGVDAELPVRAFQDTLPDIRITAGWMVYYQAGDGRIYGANLGLRYDFAARGFGNPFAGLGAFVANLWPFGGDDNEAE